MGDRTHYTLTLPACLPDEVALAAARAFYGDDPNDLSPVPAEAAALRDAREDSDKSLVFVEEQRSIGEEVEAAQAVWMVLMQAGHRVPFQVQGDPYLYLGYLVRWHPELGPHRVDCDVDGAPRLDDTDVRKAMHAAHPGAGLATLAQLAGLAWADAWQSWIGEESAAQDGRGVFAPRVGDRVLFHSIYEQTKHLNGQVVQVERVVTDPEEVDDLVLPVYRVRLPAGEVIEAWPEELHPHGQPVVPGPDSLDPNDWRGQPRTYERVPVLPDSHFRRVGSRESAA